MTDSDDATTVLCRRCSIRKLHDDIRTNYGMASDGTAAGGLCNRCAEEIAAVTVPKAVASWLASGGEPEGNHDVYQG